jgi:putative ABC transport system permease protein
MRPLFVLRWAARDLRRRWVQVAAIALVIAIGTGVYAALGSTASWRRESNDRSFELVAMYDLRVRMPEGVDAAEGTMLEALTRLPDPTIVATAEERLVVPTQVDASTPERTILVPGRLIGVDVRDDGPHVNRLVVDATRGRQLTAADDGAAVAVLERNFAEYYDLPPTGEVRVAGNTTLRYVGLGLAPEYFLVTTEEGGFFAQANFAATFVPLTTAQQLSGHLGRVNDLVLRLRPDIDLEAAELQVHETLAAAGMGGATVMTAEDEDAYRLLYDDIEGDQRFWDVFAMLILAGAAFGAFNLSSRMIDAQRREIGVGMALGATTRQLAMRPLIVGGLIACLGAILGIVVGVAAIFALRPVFTSLLPLPVWRTGFQPATFVRGAALGFALPLLATIWPVARAVRMTPLDAISTTHRNARRGLAPLLRRLTWPVSVFRRMPIGNVLRTPRRTVLTAFGIGAAASTLIAILGMLDSFATTLDRNDRAVLATHPDRLSVSLDGLVAIESPTVRSIAADPTVGAVSPIVRVAAHLDRPGRPGFDVLLDAVDATSTVWTPALRAGAFDPGQPGIVLSAKAAADLGLGVGDSVDVTHPVRRGTTVSTARTPLPVVGIHDGAFRFNAYIDRTQLVAVGAEGLANQLDVLPAAGHSVGQVQRALFERAGVGSVQPVAAASEVVQQSIDDFVGVFRVIEAFILLLVLLIGYNAASINADERAKERATLFAFGLPPRRVVVLEVVESAIYGLLGTAIGVVTGILVLRWVVDTVANSTMPDLGMDVSLSPATLLTALVIGVGSVAAAPLFTIRRLRRMSIPSTLRLVE